MQTYSGRKASQNEFELNSFISFLKEKNVDSYLEVGAREGDTFYEVMTSLKKGARGIALDLPGGLWGKRTTSTSLESAIYDLRHQGYDVSCILGDSTNPEIIKLVRSHAPFDCVFIDGDHTLKGVTKDWENYKDMAPMIAFHDIVGRGQAEKKFGNGVEVPILWEKLTKEHRYKEFIDTDSKMGIGICFGSV